MKTDDTSERFCLPGRIREFFLVRLIVALGPKSRRMYLSSVLVLERTNEIGPTALEHLDRLAMRAVDGVDLLLGLSINLCGIPRFGHLREFKLVFKVK